MWFGYFNAMALNLVVAGALSVSPTLAAPSTPVGEASYNNPQDVDIPAWLPRTEPRVRLTYGTDSPLQFADLRLPQGKRPQQGYPVIIFIHGGAWLSEWNKDHSDRLAEALSNLGFAVWSLEYRRIGNTHGGFPGTFTDVGLGADSIRSIARQYHLDLNRTIAVGHSAGGTMALWLAGRHNLPSTSTLFSPHPIKLRGVVAIAPIFDVESWVVNRKREATLEKFGVHNNAEAKAFYAQVSPINLLPLGVPISVIDATKDLVDDPGDSAWRRTADQDFDNRAISKGEKLHTVFLDGANHFDLIDADGPAFKTLKAAVLSLLPVQK